MKKIKKHKRIWIIGGIVLILGLAALILIQTRRSDAAGTDIGETAVAFMGDVGESATASGQIVAQREADLYLPSTGQVEEVKISVGDEVESGDVLVQLYTGSLERAVNSAEKDVAIAKARLTNLMAGASAEDLTRAEAAMISAQARLDDLLAGPSEEEIAASKASVKAAQANVWSASGNVQEANEVSDADILRAEANLAAALEQQEAAHNTWVRLADCQENDSGTYDCAPKENDRMASVVQNVQAANAQVAKAQAQLDELGNPDANSVGSAQANLAMNAAQFDAAVSRHEAQLLGASASEIAAAEADLANSKASLESLRSGPSQTDIVIYEIRLAQAETALQEAINALSDATLVAPFEGTITAVNVSEGEYASGLAATIIDTKTLEAVLNVDEIDVGHLSVGQPATVVMETWPNVEIKGAITAIAPSANANRSGAVSYDVHLNLQETDLPILVGMTANADILTAIQADVLLVPNSAITADRENGTFVVNLVHTEPDGSLGITEVEVTLGLKNKQYTQIARGLADGDVVLIGELKAPAEPNGFGPG
jgi:RND family efflux transporter MFP subunit